MHDALKNIERVDKLVFPLLNIEQPNLNTPDIKKNEKLRAYIRIIEKILAETIVSIDEKIEEINKFTTIFEKRPENIIMDLKKKSFAL